MQTKQLLEQIDSAMSLLAAVRLAIEEAAPTPAANIAKEEAEGICHFCKKPLGDEKKPVRGCHQRCNQTMTRAKKAGEISDAELMAEGLIGPPRPAGRKRKSSALDTLKAQAKATAKADADREHALAQRQRKGGSKT
jgi:hypothetical protein